MEKEKGKIEIKKVKPYLTQCRVLQVENVDFDAEFRKTDTKINLKENMKDEKKEVQSYNIE